MLAAMPNPTPIRPRNSGPIIFSIISRWAMVWPHIKRQVTDNGHINAKTGAKATEDNFSG